MQRRSRATVYGSLGPRSEGPARRTPTSCGLCQGATVTKAIRGSSASEFTDLKSSSALLRHIHSSPGPRLMADRNGSTMLPACATQSTAKDHPPAIDRALRISRELAWRNSHFSRQDSRRSLDVAHRSHIPISNKPKSSGRCAALKQLYPCERDRTQSRIALTCLGRLRSARSRLHAPKPLACASMPPRIPA